MKRDVYYVVLLLIVGTVLIIGLPWTAYLEGKADGLCEGRGGERIEVDGETRCVEAATLQEVEE